MENNQTDPLLKTPLFDNLRKLITIIDELRDVGLQEFINLPRIAVLGTQSSGKSSLLESIVGLDFLPRGDGVVTRRPLEMRLVHEHGNDNMSPWAVFEVEKNIKYTDFNKVRLKIEELTDKVAGKNKGIIPDPIILTIHSQDVPDLTLVDLPGITRIPLSGSDQKQDIEKVTKDMALHYVKDERTIILCVIPANADISTSDGLQMARKLDPDGKRTIGVITKIDIMDRGTNAKNMIMGKDIQLRLGYVGVKNRSQEDIINNMRVRSALQVEKEYFSKHPIYSTMPQNLLGTEALTSKLSTVMFHHIRAFLPKIIKEISEKVKDCEERLKDLGPVLPTNKKEKMNLLWHIISDFSENYKNQIRGKYDGKKRININQEISGGAVIKQMFNDLYKEFKEAGFKATNEYSDSQIERAIILHQGDSIPGFPSIDSFLYLIQPQLEKIREPALDTLHNVFIYLENLTTKLIDKLFHRFPQIVGEVTDIVSRVLQKERDNAKVVVENIIDAELGYLFTNDHEYLLSRTNIIPQQDGQQKQNLNAQQVFILELRNRIDAYFNLVVRGVRDSVPKAIGWFLVRQSQEVMQYSLYDDIMKNEQIMEMLGEPAHVTNERETINGILNVLKNAQKVLKKDPDLAVYEKIKEDLPEKKVERQETQQIERQKSQQIPQNNNQYQTSQQLNQQAQINNQQRNINNQVPKQQVNKQPVITDNSLFGF